MPKVKCDWNCCQHNSNKDPDSGDPGECLFDGTVELVDNTGEEEDSRLICKQYEWEAE